MSKTKIAWTERSLNPVVGCTPVSAGCKNCYARVLAGRLQKMGHDKYKDGFKFCLHPEAMEEPMMISTPSVFFAASMGDIFHEDVPFEFIDYIVGVMKLCRQHQFLVLTKRAERMYEYWNSRDFKIPVNVHSGITIENSDYLYRLDYLKKLEGPGKKWISFEPLIGDVGTLDLTGIDWVIVGGENAKKNEARQMKEEWAASIMDQAEAQGVKRFFKQVGSIGFDGKYRSVKKNGCLLGGKEIKEYPNLKE